MANGDFGTIELIISIISIMIAIAVITITRHYERKNLVFNSIMHVFNRLGHEENVKSRGEVYRLWKENMNNVEKLKLLYQNSEFIKHAERVMRDFDELGILVYKKINLENKKVEGYFQGFLPKEVFFNAYAGAIINSWVTLEDFINGIKIEREEPRFKRYFEKLYDDAKEYRIKVGYGETKYQKLAKNAERVNKVVFDDES